MTHGLLVVKFWIHITKTEQMKRFRKRARIAHKRWKITEEDWRNRKKWANYTMAVDEMVARTSTQVAPWTLVEGNDKMYARIKVLKTLADSLEARLARCHEEERRKRFRTEEQRNRGQTEVPAD